MARCAAAPLANQCLSYALESVGNDGAEGPRTTAAFRAAAKALIDLSRGTRATRPRRQARAHVIVGQDIAGADDHRSGGGLSQALAPVDLAGRIQCVFIAGNIPGPRLEQFKIARPSAQPQGLPRVGPRFALAGAPGPWRQSSRGNTHATCRSVTFIGFHLAMPGETRVSDSHDEICDGSEVAHKSGIQGKLSSPFMWSRSTRPSTPAFFALELWIVQRARRSFRARVPDFCCAAVRKRTAVVGGLEYFQSRELELFHFQKIALALPEVRVYSRFQT